MPNSLTTRWDLLTPLDPDRIDVWLEGDPNLTQDWYLVQLSACLGSILVAACNAEGTTFIAYAVPMTALDLEDVRPPIGVQVRIWDSEFQHSDQIATLAGIRVGLWVSREAAREIAAESKITVQ